MTTQILDHVSPNAQAPASTPTRIAPRPTLRTYRPWSLCRQCGGEYYPEDIPEALADVGAYGTCGDCREEAVAA